LPLSHATHLPHTCHVAATHCHTCHVIATHCHACHTATVTATHLRHCCHTTTVTGCHCLCHTATATCHTVATHLPLPHTCHTLPLATLPHYCHTVATLPLATLLPHAFHTCHCHTVATHCQTLATLATHLPHTATLPLPLPLPHTATHLPHTCHCHCHTLATATATLPPLYIYKSPQSPIFFKKMEHAAQKKNRRLWDRGFQLKSRLRFAFFGLISGKNCRFGAGNTVFFGGKSGAGTKFHQKQPFFAFFFASFSRFWGRDFERKIGDFRRILVVFCVFFVCFCGLWMGNCDLDFLMLGSVGK
jgi:hypothetical protein